MELPLVAPCRPEEKFRVLPGMFFLIMEKILELPES